MIRITYPARYVLSLLALYGLQVVCRETGRLLPWLTLRLMLLVWILLAVVMVSVNLIRRRFRQVIPIVAAPCALILSIWIANLAGLTPDRIWFLFRGNTYVADLLRHPATSSPIRIRMWGWRSYPTGFLAGSGQITETLVYDSSDQIALPHPARSAAWYGSADAAGYGKSFLVHPEYLEDVRAFDGATRTTSLGGHFYVVSVEL